VRKEKEKGRKGEGKGKGMKGRKGEREGKGRKGEVCVIPTSRFLFSRYWVKIMIHALLTSWDRAKTEMKENTSLSESYCNYKSAY
jgi:hypothetical protein